jgi:hypothetical protein
MKKSAIFFLQICLVISCFSCNTVDDMTEVTLDTTLSETLQINVTSIQLMSTTKVLDASTNPDVKDHLDKIKQYEITELKFAIENYDAPNEDEIYFNGDIGFSKKTENAASSTCPISNLPITNFAGNGDFELSTCANILDDISAILTSDDAVKIYMTGSFTKSPVSFDLEVTAKVKITAGP